MQGRPLLVPGVTCPSTCPPPSKTGHPQHQPQLAAEKKMIFMASKVKKDSGATLERFLALGTLNEWLLIQILDQAGVQSAKINGVTGSLVFRSNSCTKRIIPMQKISADLFSS